HVDRGRLPAAAGRHGDEGEAQKIDGYGRVDLGERIEDRERLAGVQMTRPQGLDGGAGAVAVHLVPDEKPPCLVVGLHADLREIQRAWSAVDQLEFEAQKLPAARALDRKST